MKSFFYSFWAMPARADVVSDIPPADRQSSNYFLGRDYRPRLTPKYFEYFKFWIKHPKYQPDVYSLAQCLASGGAKRIIDVGCGKAEKLQPLADRFDIIGVDFGANIEYCKKTHRFGRWIAHDLGIEQPFPLAASDIRDSIMI